MSYCHVAGRYVVQDRIIAGMGVTFRYPTKYRYRFSLALQLNNRTLARAVAAIRKRHQS